MASTGLRKVSPIPQRYNLKAIHNSAPAQGWGGRWCHQYLKDTIWKQFTTMNTLQVSVVRVSPTPHRYNVKAIQTVNGGITKDDTVSPIPQRYNLKAIHNYFLCWNNWQKVSPIPQRYNLKAIHNEFGLEYEIKVGVTNTSKIQSESNSQQCDETGFFPYWCHQYLKDTIWKQFTTVIPFCFAICSVSPIPQRYNLKAIHNPSSQIHLQLTGVTNTSKIQSESNSQLNGSTSGILNWCHQYLKDTIWKQFTTL